MPTNSRFTNFVRNISITASDAQDAYSKVNGVAGKLHATYHDPRYAQEATRLIIGSYGKGTQVKPTRDVDILFLMPRSELSRYDNYQGNGQSALLQDVRRALQQRYPATDIRGDGQVVVVPFSNGHTVELLPAWRRESGQFIIPNTHDGGSWKLADHAAEIDNVAQSDARSQGNTRALIKMLKTWQAVCNVPIKSLVLELRAVNFMNSWQYFAESSMYWDFMVRDFLSELITFANFRCEVPGTEEYCDYGDAWFASRERTRVQQRPACMRRQR